MGNPIARLGSLKKQKSISEVGHSGKRRPLKLGILLRRTGVKASIGKLDGHILIAVRRSPECTSGKPVIHMMCKKHEDTQGHEENANQDLPLPEHPNGKWG